MSRYFEELSNQEIEEDIVIRSLIDDITDELAAMTAEERLAWFRKSQYPYPLNFIKEIDGTVYTVRHYFNPNATESIREKAGRILLKV